jgi:hypothetical protein
MSIMAKSMCPSLKIVKAVSASEAVLARCPADLRAYSTTSEIWGSSSTTNILVIDISPGEIGEESPD